ncbi:MAG TPA: hypothetical protein VF459_03210 [Caulobacteraceae bacterium]
MRPIGIGLAIALIAAVLTPSAVLAAKPAAAPAVSKEQRDKGMKEAPAAVTASGAECQIADARYVGGNADPKTKAKTDFYEVACTGGEGLVVSKTATAAVAYTCLETGEGPDGKPTTLACLLPGNADPKAGVAPYIAKGGVTDCTVDKARALGRSATSVVFEVACHNGNGYVVIAAAPLRLDKPVEANPCVAYEPESTMACKLTDRASQLAVADRLMATSGKPCTVKDRSYLGVSQQKHENLFEVACQDGKGYVVVETADGKLDTAIDCTTTDMCKLTDTRQAKTEQAGLYTKLARKAGFECDVKAYAPFPSANPSIDAVELTCNNRPDGGVGVFTATTNNVYDCAHAEIQGYRCSNTPPEQVTPRLTDDLKKMGKTSCAVSGSRFVGTTADSHSFIEVTCADGGQGYMIEYTKGPPTPVNAIVCSQAGGIANGCTLKGNAKKG